MKKLYITLAAAITMAVTVTAQEVVELKQPNSNKVVVKLMFRNGSISDPAGKEGLTDITTSIISDGGTTKMTKSQIDDALYPWSAFIGASVDKEVSIFTFQCPSAYIDQFYPIMMDVMTSPAFSQEDFARIKSNQQNYVDEVDAQNLIYGAATGMIATLDPFSHFMVPEAREEMQTVTEGQFGGLGIRIMMKDGWLTVITPLPETPAYRAGVLPEDSSLFKILWQLKFA